MEKYYVEGVYLPRQKAKKANPGGAYRASDLEPFARIFWAKSPEDALQQATESLQGGLWIEKPRVSRQSEEDRMRMAKAPELPGFAASKKKSK
jgi:hypothetical protein